MLFRRFYSWIQRHDAGVFRLAAAAVCLILLTGCGSSPADNNAQAGPPKAGVITVSVRPVTITAELSGRTAPFLIAEVRPQVAGIILDRMFQEGADVKAGEPLYQIDPALYRARVNSAKATLQKAKANVDSANARVVRYKEMLKTRSVSIQDYDDAVAAARQTAAEVAIAEAELEHASIELERTFVRSPITGRIGKSNVTQGALVTASQADPLATVQQLNPMYVDVTQSSVDYMRLKREVESGLFHSVNGDALVVLVLEDGSIYGEKGAVQFSDITVNRDTGSITLRVKFANPKQELLPNVYVRARLQTASQPEGITLPQQSVSRDAKGQAYALVVGEGGAVERRAVTAPRTLGNAWLITGGLKAGEKVVVDGFQNIVFSEQGPAPVITPVPVEAR